MTSVQGPAVDVECLAELTGFRQELYRCFTRRGDALVGLADAILCKRGPVDSPVELCMEPEFGRGHGAVFDCLNSGRIDFAALRAAQIGVLPTPLPGQPMMFAIDQTPLARPDARYADQMTMDSTAITHGLQDRDVQLVIRLKSNRCFCGRPAPRMPGQQGPARRHGEKLELRAGGTRPVPDLHLTRYSGRYGQMQITAWHHMHQKLDRSGPFKDWPKDQDLPVVEGTVVRMNVEHLPDGRKAGKDMWLWIKSTSTGSARSTSGWTVRTWHPPKPPTGGWRWPSRRIPSCGWPRRWSPTPAAPGTRNCRPGRS